MSLFELSTIYPEDQRAMAAVDRLLQREGIRRDAHLDHTLGLWDEEGELAATGSFFGNTLRCLAVDSAHRGEGLMNRVVSELTSMEARLGRTHLFLYTKCDKAPVFRDLGFNEIARVDGEVLFMENRRRGFAEYVEGLRQETGDRSGSVRGAVVMNANPFTLGHQYLLETAAAGCDLLHVFLVSEDASLVPLDARRRLLREGSAHIPNVVYHETGSYMISSATFPSYFLRDEDAAYSAHAALDVEVFLRLAHELGVTRRFAGEEPFSQVTGLYNRTMAERLPKAGVDFVEVPRLRREGAAVSASKVRALLKAGDMEAVRELVPPSTYAYFASPEAEPVLEVIRAQENVVHH